MYQIEGLHAILACGTQRIQRRMPSQARPRMPACSTRSSAPRGTSATVCSPASTRKVASCWPAATGATTGSFRTTSVLRRLAVPSGTPPPPRSPPRQPPQGGRLRPCRHRGDHWLIPHNLGFEAAGGTCGHRHDQRLRLSYPHLGSTAFPDFGGHNGLVGIKQLDRLKCCVTPVQEFLRFVGTGVFAVCAQNNGQIG